MLRKLLVRGAIPAALVASLALAGCSSGGGGGSAQSASGGGEDGAPCKDTLTVWTLTDELGEIVDDYYLPAHPDLGYKVEVVSIPNDQMQTKIDPVLGTKDAPDVLAMEGQWVKKYVNSGKLADLNELADIDTSDTYPYVTDIGTSEDGVLRANSWQAAPGAFFYRQSMAEDVLGAKTPEDMEKHVSDVAGLLSVAKSMKESNIYANAALGEVSGPAIGARKQAWVVDNKLVIDQGLIDIMDVAKEVVDDGYTLDAESWGEAWFAGMSGDEIFYYSLPSWGLHYVITPNAGDTIGDWRVIRGPWDYFSGGTWIGATADSCMAKEAADLIKWVTTDQDFLKQWADDKGDFVSSRSVIASLVETYEGNETLGGQNQYKVLAEIAENIDGKVVSEYDATLSDLFLSDALSPYAKGELPDKEAALRQFKESVADRYPSLEVEFD